VRKQWHRKEQVVGTSPARARGPTATLAKAAGLVAPRRMVGPAQPKALFLPKAWQPFTGTVAKLWEGIRLWVGPPTAEELDSGVFIGGCTAKKRHVGIQCQEAFFEEAFLG